MMRFVALWAIVALASCSALADSKKLTEDQRIEIIRGIMAEYAKIKLPIPQ
jgi:ribonuclease HII